MLQLMPVRRLTPRRTAWGGLLGGLAVIGACTSVRGVPPVQYLIDNSPEVVWVTDTSHTVVPVAEPVIKRDTLRGVWQGSRLKIPLSEIESVQARVPDHVKTALLAGTLGVAAVSALYFGFISQAGPGGDGTNCGLDARGDQITVC